MNWIATSRPASGHDASAKARSTARTSAPQAGTPRSWNGAARLVPSRREQAPRRRIGGADLAGPVDDEHAVFHLLDHEPVELRLLARHLEAAARAQLLAREPAGELAGEHGDDEEAAAGEAGLRHQQRRVAARDQAEPRGAEQRQRRDGGGREREDARRQHAGHQHRQDEQGDVVEARSRRGDVQRGEERQVGADRRQPLRALQARERLRRGAAPKARQQPHADRQRRIGRCSRRRTGAGRPQAERAGQRQRHDQGDADRRARRDERAEDALEGRLGDGAAAAAALAAAARCRSATTPRSASPRSAPGCRRSRRTRRTTIRRRPSAGAPAAAAPARRHRNGTWRSSARAARRPTGEGRSTERVARRRSHGARFCAFSNAVRCASPQKTPPRPGSASSRGR